MSAGDSHQCGFSLVEIAIVLVVIGLLIGGGVVALETSRERHKRIKQREQLAEIREALHGFAMSRGRLPCPDESDPPNGNEGTGDTPDPGCDGGSTATAFGKLPWNQLGVAGRDAWGDPMLYAVTTAYTSEDIALTLTGRLDVEDADREDADLATSVPVVVVSFAGQGAQVWRAGLPCHPPPAGFSEDELENCETGNATFRSGSYRRPDAPDGRYDDLVTWLSDSVLKARMVEAGRLP